VSTSAQRVRQRQQRETTRREILIAADRFLRERPYRDLSVEQLMNQTGLSRTAFYRHFDDVSQLVLRLLEDIGSELEAIGEHWRAEAGLNYPLGAHEALTGIVQFFVRNGPLVRAIAEAASTDEQIESGYRRLLDVFTDLTEQGLAAMISRGQIDPLPNPGALARALNLMNEAYLLEGFGREPQGDPQVALATLETIWLRAIGSVRPST
jgi:TetR/AcrR family transcriptional regulator, ethionamide resistance regulator